MDIRGIANSATESVNENVPVTVQRSTGFTATGTGARQVPTYAAPVAGFAQIQALNNSDLKHLEGLNIQGNLMALYLRGALAEVVRPNQVGGDIVTWNGQTWLTVKVMESWPLWVKVAIVLQSPAS